MKEGSEARIFIAKCTTKGNEGLVGQYNRQEAIYSCFVKPCLWYSMVLFCSQPSSSQRSGMKCRIPINCVVTPDLTICPPSSPLVNTSIANRTTLSSTRDQTSTVALDKMKLTAVALLGFTTLATASISSPPQSGVDIFARASCGVTCACNNGKCRCITCTETCDWYDTNRKC